MYQDWLTSVLLLGLSPCGDYVMLGLPNITLRALLRT